MSAHETFSPEKDVPFNYECFPAGEAFKTKQCRLISEAEGLDYYDWKVWAHPRYPPKQMGVYIHPRVYAKVNQMQENKDQKHKESSLRSLERMSNRIEVSIDDRYPRLPDEIIDGIVLAVRSEVGCSNQGIYHQTSRDDINELVDKACDYQFETLFPGRIVDDPAHPAACIWGPRSSRKKRARTAHENSPPPPPRKRAAPAPASAHRKRVRRDDDDLDDAGPPRASSSSSSSSKAAKTKRASPVKVAGRKDWERSGGGGSDGEIVQEALPSKFLGLGQGNRLGGDDLAGGSQHRSTAGGNVLGGGGKVGVKAAPNKKKQSRAVKKEREGSFDLEWWA